MNILNAFQVIDQYGGQLPTTAEELKKIPGIGPYTSGAISSIAMGAVSPIVDGNVIRVLSRLRAIASDPKDKALVTLCWTLASKIVCPDHPGDFNQGLMELGATICNVKSPKCDQCPVRSICHAYGEVTSSQRPLYANAHASLLSEGT